MGSPINVVPEFPTEAKTVLLTEQAKYDPDIVAKIKKQPTGGGDVVITSGLLKALQGKGLGDIVELEYTGQTVSTREFQGFRLGGANKAESDILIPQIRYATNDAWEIVSALTSPAKTSGTPILLSTKYSKGMLYVLTIPQAMGICIATRSVFYGLSATCWRRICTCGWMRRPGSVCSWI